MVSVVINWQDTEPGEDASEEALLRNFSYQLNKLKEYPRVQANVASAWGTQRGREVLVGLLVDDRDRHATKVQGFPEHIVITLSALLDLHDTRFPQHKPKQQPWDWNIR